jgi:predicted  nucleic acid-binding Zn-ribbon protein
LSIVDQIKALEELAAIDAEIRSLDDQITKERAQLSTSRAALAKLDEKLAQSRATLAGLDKQRSDSLIEVRNMNQQLEHSREKLNRSRTERESNAAQREIEELRKLIRDREDEVARVTGEADLLRKDLESTEAEHKKIADEIGATEGDTQARLGTSEGERSQRATLRDPVIKKLPITLFKKYEQIRLKRGTGIAQTSDGTCKACNMSLPPQLFHRLRREPMIEMCPSCNRLIYFVAPPDPPKKAAPEKTK